MENIGTKHVRQGLKSTDEMCDLYMMYWVDVEDDKKEERSLIEGGNVCQSYGPPATTWQKLGLTNIPTIESSTL